MRNQPKQWGLAGDHRLHASVLVVFASVAIQNCYSCGTVEQRSLGAQPNPATVGQEVTITDSFRLKPGARPNSVSFDLDGNGSFETPGTIQAGGGLGTVATARKTYNAPATILIASLLTSTDLLTASDTEGELLRIQAPPDQPPANQPPAASFAMNPNPAVRESDITYDASASMDPDGQVVRYEWDLANDGTFERDEGANPAFTKQDDHLAGTYTIGLRVTDDDGATATTTRQLVIEEPPFLARPAKAARRLNGARTFEFPPKLISVDPGEYMLNGEDLILVGRKDRGKILASPFPAALRQGKRKVRWTGNIDATFDGETDEAHGTGFALLAFPAGGRACMAFRVDVSPPDGKTQGSFRILGGVGAAKGLRGRGAGVGEFEDGVISVRGRIHVNLDGKKRFRLGRSGCAPLLGL